MRSLYLKAYWLSWGGEYSQFLEAKSQLTLDRPGRRCYSLHDLVRALRQFQIPRYYRSGRNYDRASRRLSL